MRTQRVSITVSLAALVVGFTSVNDAQARCENRLIDKSFSCSFRSDFGVPERGQSCIEFSDDIEGDPPNLKRLTSARTVWEVLLGTLAPVIRWARALTDLEQGFRALE
jgi:hypothetical protein